MAYLLDTNLFIDAKNRYYGFDFCPAFWDWLIKKNNEEIVFSIEAVYDEIKKGNDDLSKWAKDVKSNNQNFFLPPDDKTVSKFSDVSTWAYDPSLDYKPTAISEFLGVADYFLVSHGLAHQMTVVTIETASPPQNPSKKRIKIPDACKALGIPFISPFEMLRQERAKFVL